MYPQPDQALKPLLDELQLHWHDKFSLFERSPVPSILEQISRKGDVAALPCLMQWVQHRRAMMRKGAESAVAIILPKLSADQIVELENLIRESWLKHVSYDGVLRAQTDAGLRLGTLDSNGWRREKALLELNKGSDAGALPFVLLRLNDWVPNVRAAAERWLASRLKSFAPEQLVTCLPIFAALTERAQGLASQYVQASLDRMATEQAAPALINALLSANSRTRRLAFSLLSKSGALRDSQIQNRLLDGSDPMLALLLLKHLHPSNAELPDELVTRAMGSKSSMVRRFAMYRMSDAQVERFNSAVQTALFDPAEGLREFAQYYFKKRLSSEELQSRYVRAMRDPASSNRTIAAAILGFRETGGVLSEEECLRWFEHRSVRIRAAALRVFAACHFDDALPRVREALMTPKSPTMGKTALAILRQHPNAVPMREISALLASERPTAIRMRAFTLLGDFGKWQRLPMLLKLAGDADEVIGKKALVSLWGWFNGFNKSQVQPSRAQVEEALTQLSGAETALEARLVVEFRALLNTIMPRVAA